LKSAADLYFTAVQILLHIACMSGVTV